VQYLLLVYANEAGWTNLTQAEQERRMAAYQAFNEALTKAGVLKAANRLQPTSTATTVRVSDGKSQVLDGPYVESKEQLAGFDLIDVPDLDAALSWAARCPGASQGLVEARPRWCATTHFVSECYVEHQKITRYILDLTIDDI
jgi:hypothetical protein